MWGKISLFSERKETCNFTFVPEVMFLNNGVGRTRIYHYTVDHFICTVKSAKLAIKIVKMNNFYTISACKH
jgi:hypothetical protein